MNNSAFHLSKLAQGVIGTVVSAFILASFGAALSAIISVSSLKESDQRQDDLMKTYVTRLEYQIQGERYLEIIRRLERMEDRQLQILGNN